jgi:hypothetical protein
MEIYRHLKARIPEQWRGRSALSELYLWGVRRDRGVYVPVVVGESD